MALEKQRETKFGDTIIADYHRVSRVVLRINPDELDDQVRIIYGSYSDKESYEKGVPAMEEIPLDFYGGDIPTDLRKAVQKFLKAIDKEALLTEELTDAIEDDEDKDSGGTG